MIKPSSLLKTIPDWTSWKNAETWIKKGIKKSEQFSNSSEFIPMEWNPLKGRPSQVFGNYADPAWRKFVYGIFLADLICYPHPPDQVTFDQLTIAMQKFPQGFRLWWTRVGREWWPAGYSAWIPMQKSLFKTFCEHPELLEDRTVPAASLDRKKPVFYIFNYSVAPALKKSEFSKLLLKTLAKDLKLQKPWGLSAVTVSPDGERVAKRFGLKKTGNLTVKGKTEFVYCGILR